ncbi:hypothetical protein [Clostridium intestinale]|uniref:DUF4320 family protein n=1 Tax=Clostridium intestinale TaxID=36845 RepID=A0A7D6ZWH0_9CLOT|nr:hypothetical protein [Clostridium intestinale]QLY81493.1 hypothetical protein HZF06_07885 [Clostridium intestinale]
MRKKKGEIQQFLIQMIGIIVSFAMLIYGVYYSKTIITYNNVNQVARKYILIMETTGQLKEGNRTKLISTLINMGLKDVDLGYIDYDTQKEYGEEVVLEINFTQNIPKLNIDGLNFSFTSEEKDVTITKSSIAKYWKKNG